MIETKLNFWDIAKIIGLLLMFVDHAGHFYFTDQEWLRGIGRGAAPIFLFLTGLAVHYRFSRELLVLASLLTISDWWINGGPNTLNILWTILLCRLLLDWLEKRGKKIRLLSYAIMCIVWIPSMLVVQYGTLGLMFALCGFIYKHASQYDPKIPHQALCGGLIIYTLISAIFSKFQPLTIMLTIPTIAVVGILLHHTATQLNTSINAPAPLKWASRYSGYIYVVQLVLFGWLTGKAL